MRALRSLWMVVVSMLAAPAAASGPPLFFFESGSARLTGESDSLLEWTVRWFRTSNAERVTVDGNADSVGSAASNLRLSRHRAEAVRDALIHRGIPADQITIRAFGEARPLVETADGVAERQNRYVIVTLEM